MKVKKFCSLMLSFILASSLFISNTYDVKASQSISYKETTDSFGNPERGFYIPVFMKLKESGTSIPVNELNRSFIQLRVDISAFASAKSSTGKDIEISSDALNNLDKALKTIKSNGGTAIVRFAYDNYFNGNDVHEPDISMIKTHISQLSKVLKNNKEVIACVESGILGLYGEIHSTKACTLENRISVIDYWLSSLPEDMLISVRTPTHFAEWLGVQTSELGTTSVVKEGMNRIGIYNDGYLGSNSDLGTYKNRSQELEWVSNQTESTFFGGEMVAYYDKDEPKNTAAYMSNEGFITHTNYLNSYWNDKAIAALKEEVYNGDDKLYNGLDGFTYVYNHLGYRYVLTDSSVSYKDNKLSVSFKVDNVGFGNMINDKVSTLVLCSKDNVYELPLNDLDIRNCKSRGSLEYNKSISVKNLKSGSYDVYLRVSEYGNYKSDNNYKCVRFANIESQYNKDIGANLIGSFKVADKSKFKKSGITYKISGDSVVITDLDNKSSVTLPSFVVYNNKKYSVNSINSDVFNKCTKLEKLVINTKISSLSSKMFKNCSKLRSVTLPSTLKAIKSNVFSGTKIKSITFNGKSSQFKSIKIDKRNSSINNKIVKTKNGSVKIILKN